MPKEKEFIAVLNDGSTIEFDEPLAFREHYADWSVSEGEEGRGVPSLLFVIRIVDDLKQYFSHDDFARYVSKVEE